MKRTGVARLPLHYGRAPRWLVARMIKLAGAIVTIIIDECGQDNGLTRYGRWLYRSFRSM